MEQKYSGGLLFPVMLIVAGLIFLLNNLGILSWDIWSLLWRLWPILLIGMGLEMMFGRRSAWSSALIAIVLLVVMGGAVWVTATSIIPGISVVSSAGKSQSVHVPLNNATSANVEIRSSVSVLRIGATDSDALVRGEVDLLPGEALEESLGSGPNLSYRLRSDFLNSVPVVGNRSPGGEWDLELNEKVPLQLKIGTGVGKAEIDLSRLQVTDLDLDTGVGKTTVTLPEQGKVKADINVGVGDLTVYIPDGVGARVRVKTGIGAVDLDGDFRTDGSYRVSPDYETAANRVDLEVNGGVGKVTIRRN